MRRYVVVTATARMSLKHHAQGQGEISGNIIILCRSLQLKVDGKRCATMWRDVVGEEAVVVAEQLA